MITMTDLQAAVAAQTTVEQSVITLLQNLTAQLQSAQTALDPSTQLAGIIASVQQNTAMLAAAVTANTPAATAPATPAAPTATAPVTTTTSTPTTTAAS